MYFDNDWSSQGSWGDDLMPFDDYDEDEDLLGSQIEEVIDMEEISELAKRKIIFNKCSSISTSQYSNIYFSEAELCMHAGDYRSALIAAYAGDLVSPSLTRKQAIECICLYQMGSRSRAVEIADTMEGKILASSEVSSFLKKKFSNTVEVLRFMPQLLGMLSQMKKEQ